MNSGQRFTGDTFHRIDTDIWTAALVADNLVSALKIFNRITPGGGGGSSGWSAMLTEFSDVVARLGNDEDPPEKTRTRLVLTTDQVSRVNQVIYWQMKYLKRHPGPARILAMWAATKVYRIKFNEECARRRIPRSTAYRARDRALTIIAQRLIADGVKPFRVGRLR